VSYQLSAVSFQVGFLYLLIPESCLLNAIILWNSVTNSLVIPMKKKRKKRKQRNRNPLPAASFHESGRQDRYDHILRQGQEQLQDYYSSADALDLDQLVGEFERLKEEEPYISLSQVAERYGVTLQELYSGITASKDRTVISYYSRPEIQQAIFSFASDRKIAVVRNFQPMFQRLRKPEDILPLMLRISVSYTSGRQWPSMHGTISRYAPDGQMTGCDLVAEIDYKRSWSKSFDIARPLVSFFRELGVCFLVKFSGHASPHIIIPAEAIPEGLHGPSAYRSFFTLVRSKVKQSSYLDRSFSRPSHFLRLPYSIHELTGKVSVPIMPKDYDNFSPRMARMESVKIMEGWWPVPSDARERNKVLVEYMSGGKAQIAVDENVKSAPVWKQTSLWEQMSEAFQKSSPAEAKIAPVADEDSYSRMIEAGQRELERRGRLSEDEALREALEQMVNVEHTPSIKKVAREHGVDTEQLWFLWRWSLRQQAFDHYSQPHTQQAIYSCVENRKIWLAAGSEDYIDLRKPEHILPLIAYVHSNQGRRNWPGFQRTKGIYDPQNHSLIGADIVVDFDFRNGSCDRVVKIMKPLLDMLQDSQVTFSVNFSGDSSLLVIISSAAIPQRIGGRKVVFQHHQLAKSLSEALRRIIRITKGAYSWKIEPYQHTCAPYSVNERTGLVCVPVDVEDLEDFSPEMARPLVVEVLKPSEIPEDAPQATEAFLRKIMV
jgi:hypothetical protein